MPRRSEQIHEVRRLRTHRSDPSAKAEHVPFVRDPALVGSLDTCRVETKQRLEIGADQIQRRLLAENVRRVGVLPCGLVARVASLPGFHDTETSELISVKERRGELFMTYNTLGRKERRQGVFAQRRTGHDSALIPVMREASRWRHDNTNIRFGKLVGDLTVS